jgi:hypothetical protein
MTVDHHLEELIEAIHNKLKKEKRRKRIACSVALGPSNNQAGTNLKSGHGVRN